MTSMAVLIMAAGNATRFGQCKQLMRVGGKPLLQHSIDIAQYISPGKVFAVSGAWHEEITQALDKQEIKNVDLIYHSGWADGLGSSIARGVEDIPSYVNGILIMLADQIALRSADILRLRSEFTGNNIVCSFYGGRRGVPAIFGQMSFRKLKNLHGDQGAKQLLYDQEFSVVECPLESAIIDIDTPEDLNEWMANYHQGCFAETSKSIRSLTL